MHFAICNVSICMQQQNDNKWPVKGYSSTSSQTTS